MSEGSAIEDLVNPDRILIEEKMKSINALKKYIQDGSKKKNIENKFMEFRVIKTDSQCIPSTKNCSINSISAICELTGANINEVSRAIGMDIALEQNFYHRKLLFGGSCFQKDILNLIYISRLLWSR